MISRAARWAALALFLTTVVAAADVTGGGGPAATSISQYPAGAIATTASATGTTSATAATLQSGGKTAFICGFSIRANATAAAVNDATVTGTIGGTLHFTQFTAVNTSDIGTIDKNFTPCIPASAANTGIVVTSGAPGSGGVVSVTAWGYKQ